MWAMTLDEFLLARIAEDEAVARTALPGPWSIDGHPAESKVWSTPRGVTVASGWERDAAHIARHDPARVLAECEAKRRIVELRESAQYQVAKAGDDPTDVFALTWRSQVIAFDAALRTLALPYADHPDFDEAWRA